MIDVNKAINLSVTGQQASDAITKAVNGGFVPSERTINGKPLTDNIVLKVEDIGTGLQGPPGQTGPKGNDGADGPAGPAGADGAQGQDGEKGDMIYALEIGPGGILSVIYVDTGTVPPLLLEGNTLYLDTAMIGG